MEVGAVEVVCDFWKELLFGVASEEMWELHLRQFVCVVGAVAYSENGVVPIPDFL
jgi:hypothetical protein